MSDPEFTLLGDAVWLDFINTAATPPGARDLLPDLPAYHRWTKASKLVSDADHVSLEEVRSFRSQLAYLAAALTEDRQPRSSVIQAINEILARAGGHQQLLRVKGAWRTRFTPGRHAHALEAVANSVALTLSESAARVRRCESCTLFFADYSPNHSRRFCSAATCGKRLRVERRRSDRSVPAP